MTPTTTDSAATPTRDDRLSFGLWTIGWVGQDQDPELPDALTAARVDQLQQSALSAGETCQQLRPDRCAFEDFRPDEYVDGRGFGFVRVRQLALEHLRSAR